MSQLNLGSLLAAIRDGKAPCKWCGKAPDDPWHLDQSSVVRCIGYEPIAIMGGSVVLPKVNA